MQISQELLELAIEENISLPTTLNTIDITSGQSVVFDEAEASESASSSNSRPPSAAREVKKRKRTSDDEKLLETVVSKLSSIESENEDISEVFGRHVGMEIKNMDNMNACIAKRLINEVLFFGSVGHLKMTASVKNE